jgi:hypothetical protein
MRHQRERTLRRAAQREKEKDLDRARRNAAVARRLHEMCKHGDEEKVYFSQDEIEADRARPNVTCEVCQKPKLRLAILWDGPPRPLPEFGDLAIKDLLRGEE